MDIRQFADRADPYPTYERLDRPPRPESRRTTDSALIMITVYNGIGDQLPMRLAKEKRWPKREWDSLGRKLRKIVTRRRVSSRTVRSVSVPLRGRKIEGLQRIAQDARDSRHRKTRTPASSTSWATQ